MKNILIIVLCVFISSFFVVEDKKNKSRSQFLQFEIYKINAEVNYNFVRFYVDAIFKKEGLNKSINENSIKVEKSNPIIVEPTLIEIDEVEIEEDLHEPLLSESEKAIDSQNFSEQKSPPPLKKQIDIVEEEVEFVETKDTKSDIVENEMVSNDFADIESTEIIDEKQVDSKDDISNKTEPKEIVIEEEEALTPKKVPVINPQKTLNEAIYFYTFEGNNAPELKKGVNEQLLECLSNRELDFNDLLNIFNENKDKSISKKALKTYLKNK